MAEELLVILLQLEAGVKPTIRLFDNETGELLVSGDLDSCYTATKNHPSWEITAVTTDGIKVLDLYVDNTYEKF